MDARTIARTLLEVADLDYVGDPMQYALDTKEKKADWLVPSGHDWIHTLRGLGFRLEHNEYTPKTGDEAGKKIEFWSGERDVKMKSGEKLQITASAYEQPELAGHIGIGIDYKPHYRDSATSVFSTTPLSPKRFKRVIADIIRRLERTKVEPDWNSYTGGVQETVNKVLKPYEYWENNRETEDEVLASI